MTWFTTPDGAKIWYRMDGNGSGGPPLVFLHGWCSNLEHWSRQVPAFAERHQVLRMDRRGHGQSSIPAGDRSPEQHAADHAALMQALGITQAVIVAHAGGGPTALELAGRHPELVRAAVFVDAGLYRGVPLEQAVKAPLIARLQAADYLEPFVRQYETYFHALTPGELAQRTAREAASTPQQVIVDELTWIMRNNTIELASRVSQPVLWVVSSNSRASAASIREHLPQAQFAQVVGAAHYLQLEVPEQFNAMLRRFLEGLTSL